MGDYDFFATPSSAPVTNGAPLGIQPHPQPPFHAAARPGTAALPADQQLMLDSAALTSRGNMLPTGVTRYPTVGRLGILDSIRAGFRLVPTCWSVLAAEPELLLVPVVVFVLGAAVALGYATAFGGIADLVSDNRYATTARLFPLLAMVNAVAAVGQAVIVAGATERLQGQNATIGRAWAAAMNQLPRLMAFGVCFAAERTATSLLRGKRWSPGTLAANAIDRGWDFATYLAIPVMLFEDQSVFGSVRRSARLVINRWGTNLTAKAVMSLAVFVAGLPLVVLAILVAVGVSPVLGLVLLATTVIALSVIAAALNGVLAAAIYRFAVTGLVVPGITERDMWTVFARRSDPYA